jgi:hypothetical protein
LSNKVKERSASKNEQPIGKLSDSINKAIMWHDLLVLIVRPWISL